MVGLRAVQWCPPTAIAGRIGRRFHSRPVLNGTADRRSGAIASSAFRRSVTSSKARRILSARCSSRGSLSGRSVTSHDCQVPGVRASLRICHNLFGRQQLLQKRVQCWEIPLFITWMPQLSTGSSKLGENVLCVKQITCNLDRPGGLLLAAAVSNEIIKAGATSYCSLEPRNSRSEGSFADHSSSALTARCNAEQMVQGSWLLSR
jgi:hypothetical protein